MLSTQTLQKPAEFSHPCQQQNQLKLAVSLVLIKVIIRMDRCQHNDKIVRFCASQCCVWKQAGGCLTCLKKYHNHMGPSVFIEQPSIQPLLRKYKTDSSTKPKVKHLQQNLHTYFDSLKVKLISYIDELDKKIRTQLCYPYLCKHNFVATYKRLKKKEYKKITQKDFRAFYQATQKMDTGEYSKEEKWLYGEAVGRYAGEFDRVVEVVAELERGVNMVDDGVQLVLDHGLESKIKELFEAAQSGRLPTITTEEVLDEPPQQENKLSTGKFQPPPTTAASNSYLLHIPSTKTRQKSIETSMTRNEDSKELETSDYNKKQIQLSEMKRKLLNLMATEKTSTSAYKSHNTSFKSSTNENSLIIKDYKDTPKKTEPSEAQIRQKMNYLRVQQSKDITSSNQSINLADKLFKIPLGRQISEIKHNKLPSQDTEKVLLLQQKKQKSPKKNVRSIVVPVKADYPIEPGEYSPLAKRKKQSLKTQTQTLGFDVKAIPQVQRKDSKKSDTAPLLTPTQHQSVELLTSSIKLKSNQAIPVLQKALSLAPNNLSAAEYLSFLLLESGSAVECLKVCNSIIQQLQGQVVYDINSIHIHNNKAVALIMLGRYSEAIPLLERCIQVKEIDRLFKNLADAFFMIGIYEKAAYNYEKAIAINGSTAEAHYNLAVCMYAQENYYNALLCIENALKLSPKETGYSELKDEIKQKL